MISQELCANMVDKWMDGPPLGAAGDTKFSYMLSEIEHFS